MNFNLSFLQDFARALFPNKEEQKLCELTHIPFWWLKHYKNSGMVDINGVPIYEGAVIRADGYGSDISKNMFYCVEYDPHDGFTSCIYGDADPLTTYQTIEVIGHCQEFKRFVGSYLRSYTEGDPLFNINEITGNIFQVIK